MTEQQGAAPAPAGINPEADGAADTGGVRPPPGLVTGEMSLDSMSKDELLAHAEKLGVKAKPAMNKPEIIQAIEKFQAGARSEDDGGQPPQGAGNSNTAPKTLEAEKEDGAAPGNAPVGTIRFQEGIEQVKVGQDEWVPTIREDIASDEPMVLLSEKRAGKTVFGKTGKPITFDQAGKATVSAIDSLYLKDLPGYSLARD
jgi:hypothetical protein